MCFFSFCHLGSIFCFLPVIPIYFAHSKTLWQWQTAERHYEGGVYSSFLVNTNICSFANFHAPPDVPGHAFVTPAALNLALIMGISPLCLSRLLLTTERWSTSKQQSLYCPVFASHQNSHIDLLALPSLTTFTLLHASLPLPLLSLVL